MELTSDATPNIDATLIYNVTQSLTGWHFECHIYIIAILWFLVALFVFIVALNLRSVAPCKGLLCRICILLCAAGIMRAVYLILDPYESKRRVHRWISRMLFILFYPIFASSFMFIFLTLLHLTKVNIRPYALQNTKVLTSIMCCFATALLLFEMLNDVYPSVLSFYVFILCVFVSWTFLVCATYFRYGALMLRSLTAAGDPTAMRYCKVRSKKMTNAEHLAASSTLEAPKIRITDENECTYSYRSENASPAMSDASEPSDSTDEPLSDKTVQAFNDNSSMNSNNGPAASPMSKKSWTSKHKKSNKKDSKSSSAAKRRKRGSSSSTSSKTRPARLRALIKIAFVPSILCFLVSVWLLSETYYTFFATSINKWEWFSVVTIARVTEVVAAIASAFVIQRGFNRL